MIKVFHLAILIKTKHLNVLIQKVKTYALQSQAVQSQAVVTAYFPSKQLPQLDFARRPSAV